MPNTTPEPFLDWSKGEPCEHCGKKLPMRMYPVTFGNFKAVQLGLAPCDCEGATEDRRKREEAEKTKDQAKQRAAMERKLEKANVPPKYREASHPYAQKMADMAKQGQWFYIYGPNGTGKTTLAMAAAIRLTDLVKSVFAIPSYQLMDAMRSRKDEDRAIFERAESCDVLIVDDFGKEASNTAYASERLFAIIDSRDKADKATIITSNYLLSEIAKKITEGAVGVAIASRLAGNCKQVPLEGEDRRLTHGQD